MLSATLKQRFVKDNNLSIAVFAEPYFEERVRLLGKEDELRNLERVIEEKFDGNEEAYLETYNKVKDAAIEYIKNSETFKQLNNDNFQVPNYNLRQGDIYKVPFIGETFISIDLSKANFSVLVKYSKDNGLDFFNTYNYEDFIGQFTDLDEIKKSKYVRQVIFGNCNCKKVISYEKKITTSILERILDETNVTISDIESLCNDEIVISCRNLCDDDLVVIKKLVEKISASTIPLHFEYFLLGNVEGSTAFVKKIYKDLDKKEFSYKIKCANPEDIIFIQKLLNGEKYTENDLVFYYNKKLATFMEYPNLSIVFNKEDDEELVAVIASAIAAYEDSKSTDDYVIKSVVRRED